MVESGPPARVRQWAAGFHCVLDSWSDAPDFSIASHADYVTDSTRGDFWAGVCDGLLATKRLRVEQDGSLFAANLDGGWFDWWKEEGPGRVFFVGSRRRTSCQHFSAIEVHDWASWLVAGFDPPIYLAVLWRKLLKDPAPRREPPHLPVGLFDPPLDPGSRVSNLVSPGRSPRLKVDFDVVEEARRCVSFESLVRACRAARLQPGVAAMAAWDRTWGEGKETS